MSPEEIENSAPEMSRMHRLMVGDLVEWHDSSEFPPIRHEGPVVAFANAERTYLEVDLGEGGNKVLTEDEVRRIA